MLNSIKEMEYSERDFKGDIITSTLKGNAFGLIFSFYCLPFERTESKFFVQNRCVLTYTLKNCGKMALGFSIIRVIHSAIRKEGLSKRHEFAGWAVGFGLVCLLM